MRTIIIWDRVGGRYQLGVYPVFRYASEEFLVFSVYKVEFLLVRQPPERASDRRPQPSANNCIIGKKNEGEGGGEGSGKSVRGAFGMEPGNALAHPIVLIP